jgi:sulfur carrier protein
MMVRLNGQPCELPDGSTVADAVAAAGSDAARRGVAVAVESDVVPRSSWDETMLEEGQRVEVLQPMQGGR